MPAPGACRARARERAPSAGMAPGAGDGSVDPAPVAARRDRRQAGSCWMGGKRLNAEDAEGWEVRGEGCRSAAIMQLCKPDSDRAARGRLTPSILPCWPKRPMTLLTFVTLAPKGFANVANVGAVRNGNVRSLNVRSAQKNGLYSAWLSRSVLSRGC